MKLRNLEITLQPSYADNPGKYVATVTYEDKNNSTKMVLDPDISGQLLAFVAPAISKFAAKAAREIEENIALSLAEVKQLPEITV